MTEREIVIAAVAALVERAYGGSWEKAFDAHDGDSDGRIDTTELVNVLKAAGIGYTFTRRAIARKIMAEVDGNGDGFVSRAEFDAVFKGSPA